VADFMDKEDDLDAAFICTGIQNYGPNPSHFLNLHFSALINTVC